MKKSMELSNFFGGVEEGSRPEMENSTQFHTHSPYSRKCHSLFFNPLILIPSENPGASSVCQAGQQAVRTQVEDN